jgi:hypothetical protein
MAIRICLGVKTMYPPAAGGVLWASLNWALGFRALGCEVIWAEEVRAEPVRDELAALVAAAQERLAPFGLAHRLAILPLDPQGRLPEIAGCLPPEAAVGVDVLVNFAYALPQRVLDAFPRTVVVDVDPGLTQTWIARGEMAFGRYDHHFTIGESVGRPGSGIPDLGVRWHHTPPCVALEWWPVAAAPPDAAFTTVTQWWGDWMPDESGHYDNSKRAGFAPFLDVPALTRQRLELAVPVIEHDERLALLRRGWCVRSASEVAASALAYRRYVQASRGEFSCAKPSYVRMQTAWLSDRTVCYLASGKPAVVQHTGPSRYLPDADGLFRFRTPREAAAMVEAAAADYDRHCRAARALAEAHFDARRVVARMLECVLH